MKKLAILSLAIMIMAISASSVFAAADSIAFSGYTWFRYTSLSSHFSDMNQDTDKMSIERTYLTWKMSYEDNIEGNITLDIPMKSGNTTNSDWTTLVKYAYVDVKQVIPMDGVIRVGQQAMNFCMIDKWQYPLIEKPVEDTNGLVSSADLGISVLGYLPGVLGMADGWADYSFFATNGNGYAKPTGTDNNIATSARLNATVLPGLSVSVSSYTSQMSTGDAYARAGINAPKNLTGIAANYYVGPFWLMGEWINGKEPNSVDSDFNNIYASSALIQYTLNDTWNFVVRQDNYNANVDNTTDTNTTNSPQTRMMYGVNYQWFKDLLVQVNYEELTYLDGPDASTATSARSTQDQMLLQFKWSF